MFSQAFTCEKVRCRTRTNNEQPITNNFIVAGAAGLEPAACGFGDRHSTN